ncbi:MAG: SPOR domain-containing protein [Methylococcales bacterium]
MADSKVTRKASADFPDKLDALLNEVETSSNDTDELLDDEETIDRLLTKDSLSENTPEEGFDVDALFNTSDRNASHKADEFSEIDALADDLLMADFDISADNEDANEFADSANADPAESLIEPPITASPPPVTNQQLAQEKAAFDEIHAQINQLWAEHEGLTHQITELADQARPDSSVSEDIQTLKAEQYQLKKTLKNNTHELPVVPFIALGIAIMAFLAGSGLGFISYNAQTEVTALTERVTRLTEEVELLLAQNSRQQLKQIQQELNLLSDQDSSFNEQLNRLNIVLKETAKKAMVDDLVLKNNHSQQAIELLLTKVESLANRKITAVRTKRIPKAVSKMQWVVNLVAFKQEWYAQRKAAEFDKKGIPAKVIQVEVNGQTWFRLTVKGFKSKSEAAAYAVKVKKILNLSSTWITKV